MRTTVIATAVSAVVFLSAPAALAGSTGTTSVNPFTPGVPPPVTTTPTATTPTTITPTTTTSSGGSLGGGAIAAISIGALVLLGGISLFIWYDARRRAPVRRRTQLASGDGARAKQRTKPRKLSPAERRRRKRGRAR